MNIFFRRVEDWRRVIGYEEFKKGIFGMGREYNVNKE